MQNLLRSNIRRISICPNRFVTKRLKGVVDQRRDSFTHIVVSPIRLTQPITKRGFLTLIAGTSINTDTSNEPVGVLQGNGKTAGTTSCMLLTNGCNPLSPERFGVWVRHSGKPACDFPIAN